MTNESTVKLVSKIEYVGPYQIQTTSLMSINYSTRIDKEFNNHRKKNISLKSNISNGKQISKK